MKSYQEQYYEILKRLINNPQKVVDSRIGKINSNFVETIRVDLKREFPLMDLKKIQFSNVLHELLWFIKGDTNIKYLYDNKCNIWNDDAYRYYVEKVNKSNNQSKLFQDEIFSKEDFLKCVSNGISGYGEMDKIYGYNWRRFNGQTDQLKNVIDGLEKNPNDRRLLITAHNPTDIENDEVGLPSCHNFMQFYTQPIPLIVRLKLAKKFTMMYIDDENAQKKLDELGVPKYYLNIWYNLRSQDFFLGNPYNVASYSILLYIIGNLVNMIPNELVSTMIDCHLYHEHIDAGNEWIKRYEINTSFHPEMYCHAEFNIKNKLTDIDNIKFDDFELNEYKPLDYIRAKLLT